MKKAAIWLIIVSIFTKALGFVREIFLAYFYGATYITDAYLISQTIPLTIFTLIGTAITTGYVPIYSEIINKESRLRAKEFTKNLINFLIIFGFIICVIVFIFPHVLVKIFASGFEGEALKLTVVFTRIFIFSIIFYSIIYVFNSYLQVNNKFIISAISSIPLNLIFILSFFLGSKYSILLMSIGSLIAVFAQMLFLHYFVRKNHYRHRIQFNWKDNYLKKLLLLTGPILIGVSVNQVNIIIDRTLASQITEGGVSALSYANHLIQFVQSVFILSIIVVIYPTISKLVAKNKLIEMKEVLSSSIISIKLFVIPATIGLLFMTTPIINFLYGRGSFDTNAINLTATTLFYYSIGLIGVSLREIYSRVFFAMQNTITPMINATIGMLINIALNIILSKYMGLAGLALATSISAIVTTFLLSYSLKKKIGKFNTKSIQKSSIKILVASLIMIFVVRYFFIFSKPLIGETVSLLLSILIGIFVYIIIIYVSKVEGVELIKKSIKEKIK